MITPKYLSIWSTYHVILLVLLFRWKTSENTMPCRRNELDKVETEKGNLGKYDAVAECFGFEEDATKKNLIYPFNRLELANQISKLRFILTKEIGDRQVTT